MKGHMTITDWTKEDLTRQSIYPHTSYIFQFLCEGSHCNHNQSKENNKKLGLVFLAPQEEVEKLTKKKEKFTVQKQKQKHQDHKRKLQQ